MKKQRIYTQNLEKGVKGKIEYFARTIHTHAETEFNNGSHVFYFDKDYIPSDIKDYVLNALKYKYRYYIIKDEGINYIGENLCKEKFMIYK